MLTALEVYGAWLTDDVCVPRTRIAELIADCERISREVGLKIAVVGHAGIGKIKREWLATEIGPVGLRVHRDIKRADPGEPLQPGIDVQPATLNT